MIMICNVPDEVIKSVRMGTWCGSSVAEKMIAKGIPLDKIRAEIERLHYHPKLDFIKNDEVVEMALDIIGKHMKGEQEC